MSIVMLPFITLANGWRLALAVEINEMHLKLDCMTPLVPSNATNIIYIYLRPRVGDES